VAAITTDALPTTVPRPADSRLATDRLRQAFGVHLPDWQTALEHTLEQIL
jgi:dTDP-4-dehydrorhamnose reductase